MDKDQAERLIAAIADLKEYLAPVVHLANWQLKWMEAQQQPAPAAPNQESSPDASKSGNQGSGA